MGTQEVTNTYLDPHISLATSAKKPNPSDQDLMSQGNTMSQLKGPEFYVIL